MSTNNGAKLPQSSNEADLKQPNKLRTDLQTRVAQGMWGSFNQSLPSEQQTSEQSSRNPQAQLIETTEPTPKIIERPREQYVRKFEQPVLLQQSPLWSRAILWLLMGVTTTTIIWASVAKIEEAIPAQGKLEPVGAVQDVQAPVGGVVKAIYIQDGQRVKQGDRLLSLDSTTAIAQFASFTKIRTSLLQENQFYQSQLRGANSVETDPTLVQLQIPPQLMSLTKSRAGLLAENQLYRAQLDGIPGSQLTPEQRERLQSNQAELSSRVAAARSEVEQLSRQLNQTNIRLGSAKDTLAMNQEILQNIEPLTKQGAMSRLQLLQQQQEARSSKSEVDQLNQEREKLKLEINEAQSKLQNTFALDRKDILTQIAENDQRIAEIDSQLTKAIVENNNRIAEIDSQIRETQQTLQYQELRAPVSGTVFELKANTPGFVTNSTEPILKIVPDDALTAKVFITNRDIGFVKEGMKVDVRIDSFPVSEFGDVKGELVWIGSDALPPDQVNPSYRFPAKVRLQQQSIVINGREVPLQSGMSLSANVKVRSRTVMSIFTDLFTEKMESLKFVR